MQITPVLLQNMPYTTRSLESNGAVSAPSSANQVASAAPIAPQPTARTGHATQQAVNEPARADKLAGNNAATADASEDAKETSGRDKGGEKSNATSATQGTGGEQLSEADLQQVKQLKATDREVRQHEMAHKTAGGEHSGAISYQYQTGPDGKRYAVAGEVSISSGPVSGDPRATIAKMQQVIAAALAPADPSSQDRKVAAQARQHLMSAQLELAQLGNEMEAARQGATASAPQQETANRPMEQAGQHREQAPT